ncbi:hypothetical protein GN244_ATG10156 [Phytophthora infestans]|uniref:Uncharacterized protein n=1 Tax=Phytophthora infestans TaxID=4787 RepID=A0A833S9I4_PHYIN|nr:hypothetical protein GN244_ATG10156 [Phytophthora infestans]KAF4143244.1 hypothetical protein GN958_ATG07605 [Phytophthora infestans]
MTGDGDEAVYASILAGVKRSELHNQLHKVVRKEYKSVSRQVRHALTSLTALRQLQAASDHLRPSGDWLPITLQTQLKSIEELHSRLETAVDALEMNAKGKRAKKRKRPLAKETLEPEKEDEVVFVEVRESLQDKLNRNHSNTTTAKKRDTTATLEQQEESDVECLEDLDLGSDVVIDQENSEEAVERRAENPAQENGDSDVEIIEVVAAERRTELKVKEQPVDVDVMSESDELPCGLVRLTRDATVRIKEEPMTYPDNQPVEAMHETGAQDTIESPIELEVLDTSDSEQSVMEMSDAEEIAIELDVPDSDSDDDFSPCKELVTQLQSANTMNQLAKFPVVVEQLRSYLIDHKHLTVTELDGYLFAHKRITEEEADELGVAIKIIIAVGMALPIRPKIRRALSDLQAVVEQLECLLDDLPAFLRPVVTKFSSYFASHVGKNLNRTK